MGLLIFDFCVCMKVISLSMGYLVVKYFFDKIIIVIWYCCVVWKIKFGNFLFSGKLLVCLLKKGKWWMFFSWLYNVFIKFFWVLLWFKNILCLGFSGEFLYIYLNVMGIWIRIFGIVVEDGKDWSRLEYYLLIDLMLIYFLL